MECVAKGREGVDCGRCECVVDGVESVEGDCEGVDCADEDDNSSPTSLALSDATLFLSLENISPPSSESCCMLVWGRLEEEVVVVTAFGGARVVASFT